jgi:hypothetical protein
VTPEQQLALTAGETRAYAEVIVPARPHLEALGQLVAHGQTIRTETARACGGKLPGSLSNDPHAPFAGIGLLQRLFGIGLALTLKLFDRIDKTMQARIANADQIRAAMEPQR